MALENYRITEFQEKTQVDNGDYVLIDSATDGTHKYQLSRIPAQASAEVAAAVAAEETAREAADAAEVTARNAAISAAISDEVTARNAAIAANVDNTLTVSGKAADAKKTGDEIADVKSDLTAETTAREAADTALAADIATKANADGVAENLTSGQTKQLLSDKYAEDSVPYQYRTSGGTADIGDREYDEIVGGTVAWNQLVNYLSGDNWATESGVTTSFQDGIATVSSEVANNGIYHKQYLNLIANHKYLFFFRAKGENGTTIGLFVANTTGMAFNVDMTGAWVDCATIKNCVEDASNRRMYLIGRYNAYENVQYKSVMIFDLTQMFGSTIADYIYSLETATAGAGIAFFRSLFPNDYYPYDAGSLKSVEGVSAHVTTGFNQWDEEWELGSYDTTTGSKATSSTTIRNKNLIHVFPNTAYYFKITTGTPRAFYYDYNGAYIGTTLVSGNAIFTTPANAHFMAFHVAGTTYNHDICINLSWSGYRNGEYEPYVKHTYPLDDSLTLRGIPKLDSANHLYYDGDTYEADGTVTRRYGVGTIPTVSRIFDDATGVGTEHYVYFMLADSAVTTASDVHIIADKIVGVKFTNRGQAYTIAMNPYGSSRVEIFVPADATLEQVNNFIAGQTIVYELATPTTEEADPYQSPQIVDDFGTEEYVTTSIVPVGHNTKYPENLRAKIEGLPWDFSTLIAPTEKTNTATRNYTSGSLLIMGNVLYKVTANIANGGTITPGTNVTATTLSEVISALS